MTSLLDVNVLLSLLDANHEHHAASKGWWRQNNDPWGFLSHHAEWVPANRDWARVPEQTQYQAGHHDPVASGFHTRS